MSYNRPDAYNQPDDLGLEIVKTLGGGVYDYDYFIVWRHTDTDTLYWASDSGCSCTVPFEWATSLDKLNVLDKDSLEQFDTELNQWLENYGNNCELDGAVQLMLKVFRELKDKDV